MRHLTTVPVSALQSGDTLARDGQTIVKVWPLCAGMSIVTMRTTSGAVVQPVWRDDLMQPVWRTS